MALSLVARSARALSEHVNGVYRVFKGLDPDSLSVRLPSSGSFRVLHSVTASAVLDVTDAGIDGADIRTATITSDKLAGGIAVPANSITTNEIANGTIGAVDIASGAISQAAQVLALPTSNANQGTPSLWYDMPGASIAMTGLTSGAIVLYAFVMVTRHSVAGGRHAYRIVRSDTTVMQGQATPFVGHGTAANDLAHVGLGYFLSPVTGSLTFKLQGFMVDAGTATTFSGNGYFQLVELRR